MRALVIGLGSMGKRRIRCLKNLGYSDIIGADPRADRRAQTMKEYAVESVENAEKAVDTADAIIISTPPDKHLEFIQLAVRKRKPSFVEASVILRGLKEVAEEAERNNLLVAPSCTMRFHPGIRMIKKLVKDGIYGNVTNFSYHCGQYLPDWHPWEKVKDFYVSRKETGGAREIVPFELTWLCDVFGYPTGVKAFYGSTMDVGAKIDDTYSITLNFGRSLGTMVIDVVSRYAIRSLILNMELAQLQWKWDVPKLLLYETASSRWKEFSFEQGLSQAGYNENISEAMYIEELNSFLQAVRAKGSYPNTLNDDIKILSILEQVEQQ